MAFVVPPSLNQYPETYTPLYLVLTQASTSSLGKWRGVKNEDINGNSFMLPAPKVGLGIGTHSVNLDEAKFWQTSSVGDKARMIFGDTLYYAVSSQGGVPFATNTGLYPIISGGPNIPKDLSALQYRGMKKRAYSFSLELFAFTNQDFSVIQQFCKSMHAASMPTIDGNGNLVAPSIWKIQIFNSSDGEVTNNWLFEPQPCSMLAFNSSALDYISIDSGYQYPARVGINMVMAEIEPVLWTGGVVATVPELFPPAGTP